MKRWLNPVEEITALQFWLRVTWVSLQLVMVYFFLSQNDPFFYQGF